MGKYVGNNSGKAFICPSDASTQSSTTNPLVRIDNPADFNADNQTSYYLMVGVDQPITADYTTTNAASQLIMVDKRFSGHRGLVNAIFLDSHSQEFVQNETNTWPDVKTMVQVKGKEVNPLNGTLKEF